MRDKESVTFGQKEPSSRILSQYFQMMAVILLRERVSQGIPAERHTQAKAMISSSAWDMGDPALQATGIYMKCVRELMCTPSLKRLKVLD